MLRYFCHKNTCNCWQLPNSGINILQYLIYCWCFKCKWIINSQKWLAPVCGSVIYIFLFSVFINLFFLHHCLLWCDTSWEVLYLWCRKYFIRMKEHKFWLGCYTFVGKCVQKWKTKTWCNNPVCLQPAGNLLQKTAELERILLSVFLGVRVFRFG